MGGLYFNPQNPLVNGDKASLPFVRFLNQLVKAIGQAAGYVPLGSVTTSGLTMSTNRLLGRTSAGTGAIQEISAGTGLSLSGGVLAATGTSSVVQVATVTLTNAQILALPTSGVAIGPSPGTGNRIRIFGVSFSLQASAGAYTNIDATYAEMGVAAGSKNVAYGPVNDSSADPAFALLTDFLGAASDHSYDVQYPTLATWNYGGAYGASSGYGLSNGFMPRASINGTQATVYIDNNGSGDFTGGNAANTLVVTMYYRIEAL